jgi:hypothetical protein
MAGKVGNYEIIAKILTKTSFAKIDIDLKFK